MNFILVHSLRLSDEKKQGSQCERGKPDPGDFVASRRIVEAPRHLQISRLDAVLAIVSIISPADEFLIP